MVSSGGRVRRSGSGKFTSSLPSGGRGFDLMAGKTNNVAPATVSVGASSLTTVSVVNLASGIAAESSKGPAATSGVVASINSKPAKAAKISSQKKDSASVVSSKKKGGDRQSEKDR
ncbi:hypothetical protein Ancab_005770 [Ancistrocladus abbreviatus]